MAVYTRITNAELRQATAPFDLSATQNLTEARDGIENSTYFFTALSPQGLTGEYVLTLLENTPPEQMHFSAALCIHLADGGLPVPAPLRDRDHNYCFALAGKNALIFPRVKGRHPKDVTAEHCTIIGDYLARSHRQGESFAQQLSNTRSLPWLLQGQQALEPFLNIEDRKLMHRQMATYQGLQTSSQELPTGAIHGDLFKDNALFDGGALSGVIDFYNACTDWLLLDVAIAVNDWCLIPGRTQLDTLLCDALLAAYQQVRPFTAVERQAWQPVLGIAATRFWVSRLMGHHVPELLGGEVKTKDPDAFKHLLLRHLAEVPPLP
jgi:homoserine kinase type II